LETGLIRCSRAAEVVTLNALLKQVAELKKNASSNSVAPSSAPEPVSSPSPQKKKKTPEEELKVMESQWREVINYMAKADSLSRRYFIDTLPLRVEETALVVGFDPEFASEKSTFEAPRIQQIFSRIVERKLGRKVRIKFEPLTPETKKILPTDHLVSKKTSSEEELSGVQKWYADPVIKNVVEAFNGSITDVRE